MSPTPEARADRARDSRILQWRVTLIGLMFALVTFAGTYYYVQHTSDRLRADRKHSDQQFTRALARLEAARKRSDKQFAKALIVTDRKFRQSLRVTTLQFSYAQNKQVCAFREKTIPELQSYREAANDPASSASSRERNAGRVGDTQRFLRSLVTIPADFDCGTLPKNPPKPEAP